MEAFDLSSERRRRLTHRGLPAIAAVALVVGVVVGASQGSGAEGVANRYAAAWARGDYAAMYRMLSPRARARVGAVAFADAHRRALDTATATALRPGRAQETGDGARVPFRVPTRAFGELRLAADLPLDGESVDWAPNLTFPGVPRGALLGRRTQAPARAAILARDGSVIARGPAAARVRPPASGAAGIAGSVAVPASAADREALYAAGFPPRARAGTSGLERALDARLRGLPGGTLLAGRTVLAAARVRAAGSLRTSLSPALQAAAETALAGRLGGIAAIDPRSGEIRALAGLATATQPPGSTFKIVTATAALEAGVVRPRTTFPVRTQAILDGVPLQNANGESCGGTFLNAFAQSCNSVFAPLGVRVGAARLAATAVRFGFNAPSPLAGTSTSTIPAATTIRSPLEVGSTAIGQGKVLATPLGMASVAATIASGGVRRPPSLIADEPGGRPVRATSAAVAATVERLMLAVVASGTGTGAALGSVRVAGKTGTAELGTTVGPTAAKQPSGAPPNTDAWFAAYAPVPGARIAVGVMFVKAGAGGDVAAPAAATVLAAGVRAR